MPAGTGWKATRKGFKFASRGGNSTGMRGVVLSDSSRMGLQVVGHGENLTFDHLPLVGVDALGQYAHAWLVRSDGGACWSSIFHHPSQNNTEGFKAKAD